MCYFYQFSLKKVREETRVEAIVFDARKKLFVEKRKTKDLLSCKSQETRSRVHIVIV